MGNNTHKNVEPVDAFAKLEQGVLAALETYSNVHRGSGHFSLVTTHLYEQAREITLEYLGLDKSKYTVIFCTPGRAKALSAQLEHDSYKSLSSLDFGLSLGVRALAVEIKALPEDVPFQTGGGTAKLFSRDWVIWANAPDKFEAGTPAIINIIAFAKALLMIQKQGENIFLDPTSKKLTAAEILYHDELENSLGHELLDKLRQTLIGRGICVPTMGGSKPFINFDNSASTPTFLPIWNAFRQTYCQSPQVKHDIVREVKSVCSEMLGAPLSAYDVIFTSNTTESINLLAESLHRDQVTDCEPVVLNTLLEHSSNDLPWRNIPNHSLVRLTVDFDGFIDLAKLEAILRAYNKNNEHRKKRIRLVAVSGASNVLGTCNNLEEISRIVHLYGARFLVDAAQLIAHRKVDMEDAGIDYLAFSAHKVYAPFGCGVLVAAKGMLNFDADELLQIQLSGEENAGGIAALGKAFVLMQRIGMDLIKEEEQALTERVLRGMAQIKGLKLYGIKDPDSPAIDSKLGVFVFGLKSMMPNKVGRELGLRSGIGVRFGCHCAHIIIRYILNFSAFLEKFQRLIQTLFPKLKLPGLVRVSLGIENSAEDVDTLLNVLDRIENKSKASVSTHNETLIMTKADVQKQIDEFVVAASKRVYSN